MGSEHQTRDPPSSFYQLAFNLRPAAWGVWRLWGGSRPARIKASVLGPFWDLGPFSLSCKQSFPWNAQVTLRKFLRRRKDDKGGGRLGGGVYRGAWTFKQAEMKRGPS